MTTKEKNAIVGMINAISDNSSFRRYICGQYIKETKESGKMDWTFSVFQIDENDEIRSLLSDPAEITNLANAIGAGSYVSVDTIGFALSDNMEGKDSQYKPYIRLY